MINIWQYFLIVNNVTKEKYLCSWTENETELFGEKVYLIGTTKGLENLINDIHKRLNKIK